MKLQALVKNKPCKFVLQHVRLTLALKASPQRKKSDETTLSSEIDFSPWALPRVRGHADPGPRSIRRLFYSADQGRQMESELFVACCAVFVFSGSSSFPHVLSGNPGTFGLDPR